MLQKLVFLANKFLFRGKEKKASYLSANSLALRFPKIFTSLVLMDYLQKVTVHVSIPLKFGHNIICDRYAYDAVASLGINLGYSFDTINRILGILLRLLPKPSLVFLVDTPAEYALRRKSDILSVSNLMRLKNILESLRPLGMLSIDGTRSLNQQTEFFGEILGLKA
jgi:thymidylate kinase